MRGLSTPRQHVNTLRGDHGAAATLVVVLLAFGSLLGLGAVVIDYGAVMGERRQLQNGSDAAALAIAQDCATNPACNATTSAATPWVSANDSATDVTGTAGVHSVCTGATSTFPCSTATGGSLTDCLAAPSRASTNWSGYVEVRSETRVVPPLMGQIFGSPPKSAGACSRAAWGPVGGLTTLPVTFSLCEWQSMTSSGTRFAPAPADDGTYPGGYPVGYEQRLYTHQGTAGNKAGACDPGPAYSDIPGGFGWLTSKPTRCEADYAVGGSNPTSDTGASLPTVCKDDLAPLVGHVVYVPIYSAVSAPPTRSYTIAGFAAFYLTGYGRVPSATPNRVPSIASRGHLCSMSDHCLYGWFVKDLAPAGSGIGPGSNFGLTTSQLAG